WTIDAFRKDLRLNNIVLDSKKSDDLICIYGIIILLKRINKKNIKDKTVKDIIDKYDYYKISLLEIQKIYNQNKKNVKDEIELVITYLEKKQYIYQIGMINDLRWIREHI
ncbi:MAG: hypothetical protein ACYDEX_23235, partial [Mobilitalea sp.]